MLEINDRNKQNPSARGGKNMVCPCFMEDYVGFCTSSEVSYVPSIDEMGKFCFTSGYCKCMLYKNGLLRAAASRGRQRRQGGRQLVATGLCSSSDEMQEAEVNAA
jgi:hypothetical protein